MDKYSLITKLVESELSAFTTLYKKSLQGHSPAFQSMIDYISEVDGKKIRPLLLLLTAKTCGQINQSTLDYALVLELVHNATLIHDDVIDNTKQRRGRYSVNAKYDNKTAVLVGDYILSIAIAKAVMTQSIPVLNIISNLALNLVDGELAQLINSNNVVISETYYFDVIRKKTAVLLSSCAQMGAMSANVDEATIEKFRLFGEHIGICFQIRDDIFDYYEQGEIGKPTGNDIREGKITLPLIYALEYAPENESKEMLQIIQNGDFTENNIDSLINFAKNNKGIEYAFHMMETYKQKAIDTLADFPETEAKKTLFNLVDYIIERKK